MNIEIRATFVGIRQPVCDKDGFAYRFITENNSIFRYSKLFKTKEECEKKAIITKLTGSFYE